VPSCLCGNFHNRPNFSHRCTFNEMSEPQMPQMAQIPKIKIGRCLINIISVISVISGSDGFFFFRTFAFPRFLFFLHHSSFIILSLLTGDHRLHELSRITRKFFLLFFSSSLLIFCSSPLFRASFFPCSLFFLAVLRVLSGY